MKVPFDEWGATAVFSGHQHTYERIYKQKPNNTRSSDSSQHTIIRNNNDNNNNNNKENIVPDDVLTYIVNGLGGHPWLYEINNCEEEQGSQARFNSHHGALLGLLSDSSTKQTGLAVGG